MNENFFANWFGDILNPVEALDKAWRDSCMSGNFSSYNQTLDNIKMSGRKVYRNSKGQHKVEENYYV